MPTIILIHGISDQPKDWAVKASQHLSQFGDVIPFQWDDILNSNVNTPLVQAGSDVSKAVTFFVPKWKIADITLRWTLDRGCDLLGYSNVRHRAFQRLESILGRITSDVIIVGHSLGSVLAYEYLALIDSCGKAHVSKFISVGSPLDRQPVKGRVLDRVRGVDHLQIEWLNVWGTIDPVVCWLPLIKNNGAMQTFKPSEQRRLVGHAHGLEGYVEALGREDFEPYRS